MNIEKIISDEILNKKKLNKDFTKFKESKIFNFVVNNKTLVLKTTKPKRCDNFCSTCFFESYCRNNNTNLQYFCYTTIFKESKEC